MEWKEKSITETVETEMKDHQVRNLEPGTGESRVDKRRGRRWLNSRMDKRREDVR